MAYPSGGFRKKQLIAGEELPALVPVSDRLSVESEGLVEESPALVQLVDSPGSESRGLVWGALCFAAAVLSSTRSVVLRGLRCLWCLSAAVRNRLAHALNGNQEGLYPWILCGIISLATYRVGEEFTESAAAVVRVTAEVIEDVFETTSIEVQETIQWVGMFVRAALVVAVWYVGRTCWSKLMHVLHGNTSTLAKSPTGDVEAWRFLLSEPGSNKPIGLCSRVSVEGPEKIYQVEGSNSASYRSVLHDTDKSKVRCSCKAYVFSGRPCKHLIEVAKREAMHGKEDVPAPARSLAVARGRAASSAHVLASQAQASGCLDGLHVLMQKAASLKTAPRPETASSSKVDVTSPLRVEVGSMSDSPLQGITVGMASLSLEDAPKERVASAPPARKGEVHAEPEFLPNSRVQEVLVDALQRMPKADVVFVAYSFDRPSIVGALEAHRGKVRLLADVSQTNGRTKQQ